MRDRGQRKVQSEAVWVKREPRVHDIEECQGNMKRAGTMWKHARGMREV